MVLSLRMFLSVEVLGISTFDTFFEQNERMRGGRFRVRSVLHSAPFLCNAEPLSFLRFA